MPSSTSSKKLSPGFNYYKQFNEEFQYDIVDVDRLTSLSVLASATIYSWVTPLLPNFLGPNSEIPMTGEGASWMVAVTDIGFLFSPLPSGVLSDVIGRKIVLLSSAPITLLGWVLILYYRSLSALVVARIIQGFASGIVYTVLPVYLGEISIPKYRGAVTSSFYCFLWFGFLFEYAIGPYLSFNSYTCITASVNVVFLAAFLWAPESPYYYLLRNDEDRARTTLAWLFFMSEDEAEIELDRMRKGHNKEKVPWKKLFATAPNRKGMLILLLNGYVRMFCGLIPLTSYSTLTLTTAGDGDLFISPDNVTIIMGVLMFLGSVCSSFTLDSFGRRPLLFFSSFTSAIIMFLISIFYFLNSNTSVNVTSFNWMPSIGFITFSAVAVIGIFLVSTTYQSELFESNTRAFASVILNIFVTLLGILIYKYYLTIFISVGIYVNFIIFTITCLISVYSSWILMPETKGMSFEQITLKLNGHTIENKACNQSIP